jgi:hypothetical protein
MKAKVSISGLFAALALLAGPAAPAQDAAPWLHVHVTGDGGHRSNVKLNLPLSLVEIALDAAPETVVSHGRIHLHSGKSDLSVADLQRLWRELRRTGEAELVTVEDEGGTVTIAQRGDRIEVRVHDPSAEREHVRVDVPAAVVDALLSGEGEELNLRDAFRELRKIRGDVVEVEGRDGSVRVWIDERK